MISSNIPKVLRHNGRQIVDVTTDSRTYETKEHHHGSCDLPDFLVFSVDVEENQRDHVEVEVAGDIPSRWVTLEAKITLTIIPRNSTHCEIQKLTLIPVNVDIK